MNKTPVPKVKENFYIGSLPGVVDGRELRRYLTQFGNITSLEVIKEPNSGKCKGYAFLSINLSIPEEEFISMPHYYAKRVIFIRKKLQGADLKVHKKQFQLRRLYLETRSECLTDSDLFEYFSRFGIVELAYFVKNYKIDLDHKVFGYVNFESEEAARMVLYSPNHLINGEYVRVEKFKLRESNGTFQALNGSPQSKNQRIKNSAKVSKPNKAKKYKSSQSTFSDSHCSEANKEQCFNETKALKAIDGKPKASISISIGSNHVADNLRFNVQPFYG